MKARLLSSTENGWTVEITAHINDVMDDDVWARVCEVVEETLGLPDGDQIGETELKIVHVWDERMFTLHVSGEERVV